VHLLGTAALQHFTGYTGQSRSRHATHTWNVARLPEVDHDGVVADDRTPGQEVLDALRRRPDTGFAIHEAPTRLERLLADRSKLRALLEQRPPDRQPALRQAELALASARKELHWAHHRLDHARQCLDEFGPLSQLRRQGREDKASTTDQIDTFTDDVRKAEAKIARAERAVEELRPEVDQRRQWDADNHWPDSRLRAVDAELDNLTRSADPSLARDASLLTRVPGVDRPAWLDQLADVAPPLLPGHDVGHGMDLGP
jgi:hypothetical protein